jgi:hypothetical protein
MDALISNEGPKDRAKVGLGCGTLLRLENARGMQVQVERGLLWITQEGDLRDILVRHGESFRLDRDGVAILSACSNTSLSLVSLAL